MATERISLEKEWYSAAQAAKYINYSRDYLCSVLASGENKLIYHPDKPANRTYQRWRFHKDWLDQFLRKKIPEPKKETRGRKPRSHDEVDHLA